MTNFSVRVLSLLAITCGSVMAQETLGSRLREAYDDAWNGYKSVPENHIGGYGVMTDPFAVARFDCKRLNDTEYQCSGPVKSNSSLDTVTAALQNHLSATLPLEFAWKVTPNFKGTPGRNLLAGAADRTGPIVAADIMVYNAKEILIDVSVVRRGQRRNDN
jgi:hypothetical protein